MINLPLLECAFDSRSDTDDVVTELITILKRTEKNLASRRKIEVLPNHVSFLEWAFNFRNNTVDIVIELILILKWTEKNLASRRKRRVLPNDALVMGIYKQH